MSNDYIENMLFFSKYKTEKRIGEGSFGRVYLAKHIQTNERFALKFENKTKAPNLLEQEAHILHYLKGSEGIPIVKSFGYSGNYSVLVMELLSKSLEDLFQSNNKSFSIKTVCMIGEQILNRIEYVHQKHLIHRDIKPDNFAIGLEDCSRIIYIIDFGLSKKYRSSNTLEHTKYANNRKLTGTARYASVNALGGFEQSRRDDLESIAYILVYFLKGTLPWQGLKHNKREERFRNILDKKKKITPDELCHGLPVEFRDFVAYSRNLGFEEEPNYYFLRRLLRQVMTRSKWQFDNVYDWIIVTRNNRMKSLTQLPTEDDIIYNADEEEENEEEGGEEEIALNNLDEHRLYTSMAVNNYKFLDSIRTHKATNYKGDKLRINSMEIHKNKNSFAFDSNKKNGTTANCLRNSTLYYSNNRNTAQLTHPLTTESDCIVF